MKEDSWEGEVCAACSTNKPPCSLLKASQFVQSQSACLRLVSLCKDSQFVQSQLVCSRLVQTDLKGLSRISCVSTLPPILQFNYLKYDLVDGSRKVFSKFSVELISQKAFRWLPARINRINQDVQPDVAPPSPQKSSSDFEILTRVLALVHF